MHLGAFMGAPEMISNEDAGRFFQTQPNAHFSRRNPEEKPLALA
jgi:hypothetical protein